MKAYRITPDGACDPQPFPCPKNLETDHLPPGVYLILPDNLQSRGSVRLERTPYKGEVAGSSPAGTTKKN